MSQSHGPSATASNPEHKCPAGAHAKFAASAQAHSAPKFSIPSRVLITVGVGIIKLYQITLSPFLGRHCRFHPTCSHYGVEALRTHGPFRGSGLTLRRLSRCHPFSGKGGYDPVPLEDE